MDAFNYVTVLLLLRYHGWNRVTSQVEKFSNYLKSRPIPIPKVTYSYLKLTASWENNYLINIFYSEFLQEASAPGGMWSSLSAICGNAPVPNSYANLLSHQLRNLPSHELQLLQQQVMMTHGIPFPLPKVALLSAGLHNGAEDKYL